MSKERLEKRIREGWDRKFHQKGTTFLWIG